MLDNRIRKVLFLITAFGCVLFAGFFTLLPKDDKNDKIVTLTYLWCGDYNENFKILDKMAELTNIRLDVTAISEIDYTARRDAILTSGEIPDVVTKTSDSVLIQKLGMEGKLLPIDEYFEYLPNFTSHVKKNHWESIITDNTAVDGHMYQLPMDIMEEKVNRKQQFIRKEVFEKLHLDIPETWEELYQDCLIIKSQYPDSYPVGVVYGTGNMLDMLAPSFGTSGGWGARRDFYHYDQENSRWVFAPETEEYKNMLIFLNRLYRDGILDPDFSSISSDMYYDKLASNQYVFAIAEWPNYDADVISRLQTTDPDAQWVPVYPLAGPNGAFTARTNWYTQGCVFSADLKDSEKFPAFLNWINWLFSEEGIDLLAYGIEGESYQRAPDGKVEFLSNIKTLSNPDGTEIMSADWGICQNSLMFVRPSETRKVPKDRIPYYDTLIKSEAENDIISESNPPLALTVDQTKIENSIVAKLNSYANTMVERFITGSASFEDYSSFIEECNARGAGELTVLYNTVWNNQQP